jgi:excisionase family DNA binding protein
MLNLLTEDAVAKQLNVSVASMRRWRLERRGPHFVKVGSLVRYRQEDLEAWLASLPTGGSSSILNSRSVSTSATFDRTLKATS